MSGIGKRVSGSWVSGNYGIMKTSTDTITTLPANLYADGNNATVGISGNTVQSGTPTPDNPIQPSECGDRTVNLFDATIEQGSITSSGDIPADNRIRTREFINIESEYITLSWSSEQNTEVYIMMYDTNGDYVRGDGWTTSPTTYRLLSTIKKIRIIWRYESQADITPSAITNIMLNSGSTPLPYEPYGVKIPISSASTTTPVYLGEVQTTRKVKKLVLTGEEYWTLQSINSYGITNLWTKLPEKFRNQDVGLSTHLTLQATLIAVTETEGFYLTSSDVLYIRINTTRVSTVTDFKAYLAAQYAAGTPVTVWYVLANETTAVVNEPLMKIGDYADTVSGITIPTIAGANTISVGTTLQPSEVTVNYKGWHPEQSVHERENGAWD